MFEFSAWRQRQVRDLQRYRCLTQLLFNDFLTDAHGPTAKTSPNMRKHSPLAEAVARQETISPPPSDGIDDAEFAK